MSPPKLFVGNSRKSNIIAMYRVGAGRQTSMASFVRATQGTVRIAPVAFRELPKAPMDDLPTGKGELLDEDGAIGPPKLKTSNIGRALEKRIADTVSLLQHAGQLLSHVQNRAAELWAQRNRCDDHLEWYRLKGGTMTSLKVPSFTRSACGLRRSLRSGCR